MMEKTAVLFCVCMAGLLHDTRSQQVIIQGISNSGLPFRLGGTAFFTVQVRDDVPDAGVWTKDGVALIRDASKVIFPYSAGFRQIVIYNLEASDEGNYTFSLRDESTSTYIRVEGGSSNVVNGAWSDWGQWYSVGPSCPSTCGTSAISSRRRDRACDNPAPANGGASCPGSSRETETFQCGDGTCPVNGGWSIWTAWTSVICSVSCGSSAFGNRTKYRYCNNPTPSAGGAPCEGDPLMTEVAACVDLSPCTVQNVWSNWGPWGSPSCTATCGSFETGPRRRTRSCIRGPCTGVSFEDEIYACGLPDCSIFNIQLSDQEKNVGEDVQLTLVTRQQVTGVWYKDNQLVSETDRIAIQVNTNLHLLSIRSVLPSDQGRYSFTAAGQSTSAFLTVRGSAPVNGAWSNWGVWYDVATCPATCGTSAVSSRRRDRVCDSPPPAHGGSGCSGPSEQIQTDPCGSAGCPVDGGWSMWTAWSNVTCPVLCGVDVQGTRNKRRYCNNPSPSNGGKMCLGADTMSEFSPCVGLSSCDGFEKVLMDTMVRPGEEHVFTVRTEESGLSGSWYKNSQTRLYNTARIQIQTQTRTHTLTIRDVQPSDGGLYTFTVDGKSTSAYLTVSGELWGEWSPWSTSACSVTCGTGERTLSRRRGCYSGSNCSGTVEETNTEKCEEKICDDSGPVWYEDPDKWLLAAVGAVIVIGVALFILIIACCVWQCRKQKAKAPTSEGTPSVYTEDRNDYLSRAKYNDPKLNGSGYMQTPIQ